MEQTENQRLKILMKELGFKSQTAFAEALGVKQGSLSDIFREKPGVGVSNSIKRQLEILYKVSQNWILSGEGDMFLKKDASFKDSPRFMLVDDPQEVNEYQAPYDNLKDRLLSSYERNIMCQENNIKLLEEMSRLKDQIIEAEREIRAMMSEEKNRKSTGSRVL